MWLLVALLAASARASDVTDVCIVGAGPAGIQLAHSLVNALDVPNVLLFESIRPGSFFDGYPRSRRLISVNRLLPPSAPPELQLRHDWNSLIDGAPRLNSTQLYPDAKEYARYLRRLVGTLPPSILRIGERVTAIEREEKTGNLLILGDIGDTSATCKRVVLATGVSQERKLRGSLGEAAVSYGDMPPSLDHNLCANFFAGKRVLIIGKGNSGGETAECALQGHAAVVHLMSRKPVKLAWDSHYVGNLRAVNTGFIDAYALKSLAGILEADANELVARRSRITGRWLLFDAPAVTAQHGFNMEEDYVAAEREVLAGEGAENATIADVLSLLPDPARDWLAMSPFRHGYDVIVSCVGFVASLHRNIRLPVAWPLLRGANGRPRTAAWWSHPDIPNLHAAGALAHGGDYKQSSGGFIHGFRHQTRALARFFAGEVHGEAFAWPGPRFEGAACDDAALVDGVTAYIVHRMQGAAGLYQMYGFLCDRFDAVFNPDGVVVIGREELPKEACMTPSREQNLPPLSLWFEYGKRPPNSDPLGAARERGSVDNPAASVFLHPILRVARDEKWTTHMAADFNSDWSDSAFYVEVVRDLVKNWLRVSKTHGAAGQ